MVNLIAHFDGNNRQFKNSRGGGFGSRSHLFTIQIRADEGTWPGKNAKGGLSLAALEGEFWAIRALVSGRDRATARWAAICRLP